MENKNKIPLLIAIFININIVVGGGFFISAETIGIKGGLLSPLIWILVGLLILPLAMILANLAKNDPVAGGIYFYSQKHIGPTWGFISGWTYLIGCIAGNSVLIVAIKNMIFKIGPNYLQQNSFSNLYEILFITFFTILSFFNVVLLNKINTIFTILKTIPFLLVIVGAFLLFKFENLSQIPTIPFSNFLGTIPIVLFAYVGIEACCSIAHIIKDGSKNTARAIIISLFIIIGLYSLIQFLILGIHGSNLSNPFAAIIPLIFNNASLINIGNLILQLSILLSFLGGVYGIFYANNWILFTMAKEKALPFPKVLSKTNKFNSPWICVLLQAFITILFITISKDEVTLMTMSDFGVVIAYILSVISFIYLYKKDKKWISISAIITCLLLLHVCFKNLSSAGIQYLVPFLLLLIIGFVCYKTTKLKYFSN